MMIDIATTSYYLLKISKKKMGILFLFYSLVCIFLIVKESFSSSSVMMHHLCSPTEAFALLHFKQSFQISDFPTCLDVDIPKTKSWNESSDCCSWDGVTCDLFTGHVIGLDLGCSLLNGTIHPNSSLFQLHHLHTLNLAYNHFNFSSIPHNIGRLTNLRHLNLSLSSFSGKIPTEISHLFNLVSLDLSYNFHGFQLDETTFETMLQNLTNLEVVSLSDINISSPIPVNISSSSLRYLALESTNLQGVITESFFLLPELENLKLGGNNLLKGVLPKIHPSNNTLLELDIYKTGISGELPDIIGTFSSLNRLDMHGCQFSGSIPDSIGNLTQIRYWDFSYNHFTGHIPSTISQLKHLTILDLSSNSFSGEIPDIFSNLQELSYLDLSNNSFIGSFPSTIVSLTHLQVLYLSSNSLSGEIPDIFSNLQELSFLDLSHNSFIGSFPSTIVSLTLLQELDLSSNSLSGPLPNNFSMLQKLTQLGLWNNSLNGIIPSSLFSLPLLGQLWLDNNRFSGLPNELKTNPNFEHLSLSHNQLSDFFPQSLVNLTNLSN